MFNKIESMSVICIMSRVKARVNMRYATESRTAAAVTRRRRYTVLLLMPGKTAWRVERADIPVQGYSSPSLPARLPEASAKATIRYP